MTDTMVYCVSYGGQWQGIYADLAAAMESVEGRYRGGSKDIAWTPLLDDGKVRCWRLDEFTQVEPNRWFRSSTGKFIETRELQ